MSDPTGINCEQSIGRCLLPPALSPARRSPLPPCRAGCPALRRAAPTGSGAGASPRWRPPAAPPEGCRQRRREEDGDKAPAATNRGALGSIDASCSVACPRQAKAPPPQPPLHSFHSLLHACSVGRHVPRSAACSPVRPLPPPCPPPEGVHVDVGGAALGGGQQAQVSVTSEVGVDAALQKQNKTKQAGPTYQNRPFTFVRTAW